MAIFGAHTSNSLAHSLSPSPCPSLSLPPSLPHSRTHSLTHSLTYLTSTQLNATQLNSTQSIIQQVQISLSSWLSKTCLTELPPFTWSRLDIQYRIIRSLHRVWGKHQRNCMYDLYYISLTKRWKNKTFYYKYSVIFWTWNALTRGAVTNIEIIPKADSCSVSPLSEPLWQWLPAPQPWLR